MPRRWRGGEAGQPLRALRSVTRPIHLLELTALLRIDS
jgi:hypothetical protein